MGLLKSTQVAWKLFIEFDDEITTGPSPAILNICPFVTLYTAPGPEAVIKIFPILSPYTSTGSSRKLADATSLSVGEPALPNEPAKVETIPFSILRTV